MTWTVILLGAVCCIMIFEVHTIRDSACLGMTTPCRFFSLNCSNGRRIQVDKLMYGTKQGICWSTYPECKVEKIGCCASTSTDSFETFNQDDTKSVLDNCSGRSSCGPLQAVRTNQIQTQKYYSMGFNYVYVDYSCVSDTANSNTGVIIGVLIPVLFVAGIVIVGVFVFRYRYRHCLKKAEVESHNEARDESPMGEHNREVTKTLSRSIYSETDASISATVSQCVHCSIEEEDYLEPSQIPEECAPRVDIIFGGSGSGFHQSPRDKKGTNSKSDNAVSNTSSVQCVNTVENKSPKRTTDTQIEKLKDLSVEGKDMSPESKPVVDANAIKTTDKVLKVKRSADNYIEFIHGELYDKPQEPKVLHSNDIGNGQNNLLPSTANASSEMSDKDIPVVFVYDYADTDGRTGNLPDGNHFNEDNIYEAVDNDLTGINDDCDKTNEVFTYDYADQDSSSINC